MAFLTFLHWWSVNLGHFCSLSLNSKNFLEKKFRLNFLWTAEILQMQTSIEGKKVEVALKYKSDWNWTDMLNE